MNDQPILFAGRGPLLARAVCRALGSVGHHVECTSLSPAVASDIGHPRSILVADVAEGDLEADGPILARFRSGRPERAVVALSRTGDSPSLVDRLVGFGVDHVIGKHGPAGAAPSIIDEDELIFTIDKLVTGNVFGIDKYLDPRVRTRSLVLARPDHCVDVLPELGAFLARMDCDRDVGQMILSVAKELIIDAFAGARPDDPVDFRFGCDGRNVLVSAEGRSPLHPVACRHAVPGAGEIGPYMASRFITQLVYNLGAGPRIEVIASFYIRDGPRGVRQSGLSHHRFAT